MLRQSGIYAITCLPSGKVYIGSSAFIAQRFRRHRAALNNGQHVNRHLQNSWNKHGGESFSFEVLETCPIDRLSEREQAFIDSTPTALRFNLRTIAESNRGFVFPAQVRAKISAVTRGRKHRPESIARMRAAQKERMKDPETRAKFRAAAENQTPEGRERIRQATIRRLSDPAERAKVSERFRNPSPELRAKRSLAMKARMSDPDELAKIRAVHLGRKRSPETCAKISEKVKARPKNAKTCALLAEMARNQTPEIRAKITASVRATAQKRTPEQRAVMYADRRRENLTPERIAQLSEAARNRLNAPENYERRMAGIRAYWEAERVRRVNIKPQTSTTR